MKHKMKILTALARFIIGAVFICSSLAKGVDPRGFAYKITEYFTGFDIPYTEKFAVIIAFIFIVVEFTIGISLLFNVKPKIGTIAGGVCLLFFTILTLVIAITDKVEECGCFGNEVILTNWQTFWKNIILLAIISLPLIRVKRLETKMAPLAEYIMLTIGVALILGVSIYSYRNIPISDIEGYSVGDDLNEKGLPMIFPNAPYARDFILHGNDYTLLAIIREPEELDEATAKELNKLSSAIRSSGYTFFGLTSDDPESNEELRRRYDITYDIGSGDELILKNLMRPSVGLLLINRGVIVAKWSGNHLPDREKIVENIPTAYALKEEHKREERTTIALILLAGLCLWSICKMSINIKNS